MGSALETLCGQAVGAGKLHMLGIYMQRSCIITGITALLLTPVYIFVSPILQILQQDKHISDLAGKYSVLVIPQLYAYALNFPVQKFLQSQSKVWVMTIISLMALALHGLLNWVLLSKLQYGLKGAAIAGNISWWFLVVAQTIYVVGGFFPVAWTGFSMLAFKSLTSFVKLSLASAIMLWLDVVHQNLHTHIFSLPFFFLFYCEKHFTMLIAFMWLSWQPGAVVLHSRYSHGGMLEKSRNCS